MKQKPGWIINICFIVFLFIIYGVIKPSELSQPFKGIGNAVFVVVLGGVSLLAASYEHESYLFKLVNLISRKYKDQNERQMVRRIIFVFCIIIAIFSICHGFYISLGYAH